ncbi:hypothetical protein E6O88_16040 [Salmonella enterica subsp. enterica serovar Bareilly]|uniref:hypothetical protein n=1 Tax=Salmonella enterica TaxID=28901 RepID=UPI0011EA5D7E|nr:hypothetical protein [Salmonella enterica]ECF4139130.1 hypothetical protein [Salmonella enterica subsp. enterica serovar Bareilly]EED3241166.1 hypothetical protein [Salmonella enterica subsp. enterica serovar Bareilly]
MFSIKKIFLFLLMCTGVSISSASYANNNHPSQSTIMVFDRKVVGEHVTTVLNQSVDNRYDYTDCDRHASYYCNGVFVTAFDGKDDYWMHPGMYKGKMSLTYFRRDIATKLYNNAGIIFWPEVRLDNELKEIYKANTAFKLFTLCAFPFNAGSNLRAQNGCGAFETPNPPADSEPCQEIGILTAEQWENKYLSEQKSMCGFLLNGTESEKNIISQMSLT